MSDYIVIAKKQLEVFAGMNPTSPRIASIAAAIAQAEAAERQVDEMKEIRRQLARIATVLNELTMPKTEAPEWEDDEE